MVLSAQRILLIDSAEAARTLLARRLRAQGHHVEEACDAAKGAEMALCSPPDAVVADLWMPGISGVQLCRLLRSEAATADIVVVLCGDSDEPRDRFWAGKAGADEYVAKRRTGELVRALTRACSKRTPSEPFFLQLGNGAQDVRDRIARHLDAALFDSVIASEVRALASAGSFERLFDLLVQFVAQVTRYRWIAMHAATSSYLAIHHRPGEAAKVDAELREVLAVSEATVMLRIEDEDASDAAKAAGDAIVRRVPFGDGTLGSLVLAPCAVSESEAPRLVTLVANELGGPLRVAELMEESQRLAATDALTGLLNRRALSALLGSEVARYQRYGHPLSLALLDVDHFKVINDRRGHASGDRVLAGLGKLLRTGIRVVDAAGRWGGEEFVVLFPNTNAEGAFAAAENLRAAIEAMALNDDGGRALQVTASIGIATLLPGESIDTFVDRADRAMYAAKMAGRNRVSALPPA